MRAGRRARGDGARAGAQRRTRCPSGSLPVAQAVTHRGAPPRRLLYHVSVLTAPSYRGRPRRRAPPAGAPLRRGRRHAAPRALGVAPLLGDAMLTTLLSADAPPLPLPQLVEAVHAARWAPTRGDGAAERATRAAAVGDDCKARRCSRFARARSALYAPSARRAAPSRRRRRRSATSSRRAPDAVDAAALAAALGAAGRACSTSSKPAAGARRALLAAIWAAAAARPRPQSGATDAVRADAARAGNVDRILAERIRST